MKDWRTYFKIIKKELYSIIEVKKRTSKPGRILIPVWLEIINKKFKIKYIHAVEINLGKSAGDHYHKKQNEIFCPFGDLFLFLKDPKTKKKTKIKLNNKNKSFYRMIFVKRGVSHLVENHTQRKQLLICLSDAPSNDAPVDYPVK